MTKILTSDNKVEYIHNISDDDDSIYYTILDYSDDDNIDYRCMPFLIKEIFYAPAAKLQIGEYFVQMPLDWGVVVGDKNLGCLEVIELMVLNDRPFQSFVMNPINGYMPDFLDLDIKEIYPEIKWFFPILKPGHILSIPLDDSSKSPLCAHFVKHINKIPDSLDISKII